ncbi:hypothetical protein B0H16DRAFT_1474981 [Mycena metata]|uniref:Uncharacterized protein n=1 Tax=Mycena metata TaxID=1033252 RepID=A0AAD7HG43_9AGAR|nr:hypothetical protein B0H16DRAFT_1474981 [Mycena metata]
MWHSHEQAAHRPAITEDKTQHLNLSQRIRQQSEILRTLDEEEYLPGDLLPIRQTQTTIWPKCDREAQQSNTFLFMRYRNELALVLTFSLLQMLDNKLDEDTRWPSAQAWAHVLAMICDTFGPNTAYNGEVSDLAAILYRFESLNDASWQLCPKLGATSIYRLAGGSLVLLLTCLFSALPPTIPAPPALRTPPSLHTPPPTTPRTHSPPLPLQGSSRSYRTHKWACTETEPALDMCSPQPPIPFAPRHLWLPPTSQCTTRPQCAPALRHDLSPEDHALATVFSSPARPDLDDLVQQASTARFSSPSQLDLVSGLGNDNVWSWDIHYTWADELDCWSEEESLGDTGLKSSLEEEQIKINATNEEEDINNEPDDQLILLVFREM